MQPGTPLIQQNAGVLEAMPNQRVRGGLYYWIALAIFFFWGTAQLEPTRILYPMHGIHVGDLLFLFLLLITSLDTKTLENKLAVLAPFKPFVFLVGFFVCWNLLSSFVNSPVSDYSPIKILGMIRPLYYLVVMAFAIDFMQRYGVIPFLTAFLTGILLGALSNLYYIGTQPDWYNIDGFLLFRSSNVVGNKLAMGMFLSAFLFMRGRFYLGMIFLTLFSYLILHSFSKGAWLTGFFALACCYVVYANARYLGLKKPLGVRLFILLVLVCVTGVCVYFWEMLSLLFEAKMQTSGMMSDGNESSVAVRWGHIKASLIMAFNNPIFGVGIDNWEAMNAKISNVVGGAFDRNDNPHNGFMNILACMGFPALVIFGLIFIYPFTRLKAHLTLSNGAKNIFIASAAMMFFISGNVMLQIYMQYFFWLFCAMVFAITHKDSEVVHNG